MAKKEKEEQVGPDLLDPSHPLLIAFKKSCPGTFKHSQMVCDMVETCAQELELDPQVMKVSAMYHDIGKMVNPTYFSENQETEDPHQSLDPWISSQIISRHVSDSVLILLGEEGFPPESIDIISHHHGNTVVQYFFTKDGGDEGKEQSFRYPGSPPNSLEAAVLMICDAVEATAASHVQNRNAVNPEDVVDQVTKRLSEDRQLDELRIGEMQTIKRVLMDELKGTYPKRVDYENGKETSDGKTKGEKEDKPTSK